MNGQKKTYEELLAEMIGPIDINTLPIKKMDLKGLMRYAKKIGKKVSELSDEEKQKFIFA